MLHPSARPPQRLENGSLVLERVHATTGMAEEIQAAVALSWPDVQQWMPWAQSGIPTVDDYRTTIQNWIKVWEDGSEFEYFMMSGGQLVGACGLTTRRGRGILEIGYWVRSDMHRQGIGSRAAALLAQAAVEIPGVQEIHIYCDPKNIKSVGVPRKLKFIHTANIPHEPQTPGESGEHMMWVLPAPELGRSNVARVLGADGLTK